MGLALIPAAFFFAAVGVSIVLRSAPATLSVDLAQPVPVATYWQQFGSTIVLLLFAALIVASWAYIGLLRRCGGSGTIGLRAIVVVAACSCAAALSFPVLFSSDTYAYALYGALSLHGLNPYAHASVEQHGALIDAALWQWGNPPPVCVYGPLFVVVARSVVALFGPLGAAAPLWGFRILSCVALICCSPLAYAVFERFGRRARIAAAAGIALNPVAIWASAEGHNDAIAIAAALAAALVFLRAGRYAGVALVAISVLLVKGPSFVAIATHRGGHYFPQFSLQAALAAFAPIWLAIAATAAICIAAFAYGLIATRSGRPHGTALIVLAAWMAIPNPYPWYGLWILPFAFVGWGTPAAWAIVAATLLAALRYYAEATSDVSTGTMVLLVALQIGLPLVIATAGMVRARLGRPGSRTPVLAFAPLRLQ